MNIGILASLDFKKEVWKFYPLTSVSSSFILENVNRKRTRFQFQRSDKIYKGVKYNGSVSNSRSIFGTAESSTVHKLDTSLFKLFIVEVGLLSQSSKIINFNHICSHGSTWLPSLFISSLASDHLQSAAAASPNAMVIPDLFGGGLAGAGNTKSSDLRDRDKADVKS